VQAAVQCTTDWGSKTAGGQGGRQRTHLHRIAVRALLPRGLPLVQGIVELVHSVGAGVTPRLVSNAVGEVPAGWWRETAWGQQDSNPKRRWKAPSGGKAGGLVVIEGVGRGSRACVQSVPASAAHGHIQDDVKLLSAAVGHNATQETRHGQAR
jgi:hypothetical protein